MSAISDAVISNLSPVPRGSLLSWIHMVIHGPKGRPAVTAVISSMPVAGSHCNCRRCQDTTQHGIIAAYGGAHGLVLVAISRPLLPNQQSVALLRRVCSALR